jgi:hypothetical protein
MTFYHRPNGKSDEYRSAYDRRTALQALSRFAVTFRDVDAPFAQQLRNPLLRGKPSMSPEECQVDLRPSQPSWQP